MWEEEQEEEQSFFYFYFLWVPSLKMKIQMVFIVVVASFLISMADSRACDFPAIYNFGDSNSDTGGISAAFYPTILPCGETFFHKAAGRGCDGRHIIDFIGLFSFSSLNFQSSFFLILGLSNLSILLLCLFKYQFLYWNFCSNFSFKFILFWCLIF